MFGPINFLLRWIMTLLLVFSTYNPSGRSYYHWAMSNDAPLTMVAVVGIGMLSAYVFLLRATWRSIKPIGALLGMIFLTLFNFMLVDIGFVTVSGDGVIVVMCLASIATLFAIGLSFSAIRARLSGQIDSDDVGQ
jgi:hypothetical protein